MLEKCFLINKGKIPKLPEKFLPEKMKVKKINKWKKAILIAFLFFSGKYKMPEIARMATIYARNCQKNNLPEKCQKIKNIIKKVLTLKYDFF